MRWEGPDNSSYRLCIWHRRLIIPRKRFERPRIGLLLIDSGRLALALFYAADLATMHVLPEVTAKDEAMKVMEALHRDLGWLVILLAVVSISIGFIELLIELQRREAKVRRLINANIVGVFIWEPDGRIVDANEAFLRMIGYSRNDLVSKRLGWTELTPAETRGHRPGGPSLSAGRWQTGLCSNLREKFLRVVGLGNIGERLRALVSPRDEGDHLEPEPD